MNIFQKLTGYGCEGDADSASIVPCRHRKKEHVAKPLATCFEGEVGLICGNDDLKTLEMGLCNGCVVEIVHNVSGGLNLIVKIYGQRYVIPRETAQNIRVKTCCAK
ncbi:MAG: FeoA family protein [Victivallales bacterium]